MESALDEALVYAERSGDRRRVLFLLIALGRAALVGPTPAVAAVERCHSLKEQGGGDRALEAVLSSILAYLVAMQGRFDDARELAAESHAILEESGLMVLHGGGRTYSGAVELLAGDPAAAERELRVGLATLEAIGEKGNLSTVAAYLAEALAVQEKDDEALEYVALSRADGVGVRRHLPRRVACGAEHPWRPAPGALGDAERLAREAVAKAAGHRLSQPARRRARAPRATCSDSRAARTRPPPPRSRPGRSTRRRGTSSPRRGSPSRLSRGDDERRHRRHLLFRERRRAGAARTIASAIGYGEAS